MLVLGAQRVKSVQHNELDVVVRLFDDEVDKRARGGCKSGPLRVSMQLAGRVDPRAKYAPLTAAGFCVSVVSEVAASYLTAWLAEVSSSKMHRIHLACSRRRTPISRVFPLVRSAHAPDSRSRPWPRGARARSRPSASARPSQRGHRARRAGSAPRSAAQCCTASRMRCGGTSRRTPVWGRMRVSAMAPLTASLRGRDEQQRGTSRAARARRG